MVAETDYSLIIKIDETNLKNQLREIQDAFKEVKIGNLNELQSVGSGFESKLGLTEYMKVLKEQPSKDDVKESDKKMEDKNRSIMDRLADRLNRARERFDYSKKFSGMFGGVTRSLLPLVGIATGVVGLTAMVVKSSEILQSTFDLFGTMIELFLRPIGDFIGLLLRPLVLAMIPMVQTYFATVYPAIAEFMPSWFKFVQGQELDPEAGDNPYLANLQDNIQGLEAIGGAIWNGIKSGWDALTGGPQMAYGEGGGVTDAVETDPDYKPQIYPWENMPHQSQGQQSIYQVLNEIAEETGMLGDDTGYIEDSLHVLEGIREEDGETNVHIQNLEDMWLTAAENSDDISLEGNAMLAHMTAEQQRAYELQQMALEGQDQMAGEDSKRNELLAKLESWGKLTETHEKLGVESLQKLVDMWQGVADGTVGHGKQTEMREEMAEEEEEEEARGVYKYSGRGGVRTFGTKKERDEYAAQFRETGMNPDFDYETGKGNIWGVGGAGAPTADKIRERVEGEVPDDGNPLAVLFKRQKLASELYGTAFYSDAASGYSRGLSNRYYDKLKNSTFMDLVEAAKDMIGAGDTVPVDIGNRIANSLNLEMYQLSAFNPAKYESIMNMPRDEWVSNIVERAKARNKSWDWGHVSRFAGHANMFGSGSIYNLVADNLLAEGGILTEPIFGFGRSGQTYMMGEKGNEAVVPMDKMGGGGNEFNITIHMNITKEVDADKVVETVTRRLQEETRRMI